MNAATASLDLKADDFVLFGLPRGFKLDRDALDARWRELQTRVHPDRFVGEGAQTQRLAMQWSVRVNEAHRRLRDPLKRAAYLCDLFGAPIDAERNTAMPTEFLMHQMQWREALDDASTAADFDAIDVEVIAVRGDLLTQIEHALDGASLDAPAAARAVRALMFVERLRDDLDRRRDPAA